MPRPLVLPQSPSRVPSRRDKSSVAAAAATKLNPAFKVRALQNRVSPETELVFNDGFWNVSRRECTWVCVSSPTLPTLSHRHICSMCRSPPVWTFLQEHFLRPFTARQTLVRACPLHSLPAAWRLLAPAVWGFDRLCPASHERVFVWLHRCAPSCVQEWAQHTVTFSFRPLLPCTGSPPSVSLTQPGAHPTNACATPLRLRCLCALHSRRVHGSRTHGMPCADHQSVLGAACEASVAD